MSKITINVGGADVSTDNDQLAVTCKANWDRNPQLHQDFHDFTTYLAFERARAAGKVKIFGSGAKS